MVLLMFLLNVKMRPPVLIVVSTLLSRSAVVVASIAGKYHMPSVQLGFLQTVFHRVRRALCLWHRKAGSGPILIMIVETLTVQVICPFLSSSVFPCVRTTFLLEMRLVLSVQYIIIALFNLSALTLPLNNPQKENKYFNYNKNYK